MKPFVVGRVEGVADIEYLALEEQVGESIEAILNRLDSKLARGSCENSLKTFSCNIF